MLEKLHNSNYLMDEVEVKVSCVCPSCGALHETVVPESIVMQLQSVPSNPEIFISTCGLWACLAEFSNSK